MVALYYLARLDLPPSPAPSAPVLLTTIFPFAFFFGVAYSESTFLLFAVLAFYGFRTRRWLLGGLCGAVATATRVPGILMLPALGWIGVARAREPTAARSAAARGRRPGRSRRERLRRVLLLHLSADRQPVRMGGDDRAVGLLPGRRAVDGAACGSMRQLVTHPYALPDDRSDGGLRHALRRHRDPVRARDPVRVAALRRRLRSVHAAEPVAAVVLGRLRGRRRATARVLFLCFIWLATIRSRSVSTALDRRVFAMFYTLGLALVHVTIHPLF